MPDQHAAFGITRAMAGIGGGAGGVGLGGGLGGGGGGGSSGAGFARIVGVGLVLVAIMAGGILVVAMSVHFGEIWGWRRLLSGDRRGWRMEEEVVVEWDF